MVFAITLVVTVIVFALLTILLKKGMDRIGRHIGRRTSDRHRAAEWILDTRSVPIEWQRDFSTSLTEAKSCSEIRDTMVQNKGRQFFLARINELIKYFEHAPVFENDLARRILLEDIRAARKRWVQTDWDSLLLQEKNVERDV